LSLQKLNKDLFNNNSGREQCLVFMTKLFFIKEAFMSLQLQMYSDGTFGYLNEDGNEKNNLTTGARVVCQQKEDESREDFITNNHIIFKPNEYGSVEDNDERIIKDFIVYLILLRKVMP
jgi:hypothetical protein